MTDEQTLYAAACRVRDAKASAWRVEKMALDIMVADATARKEAMEGHFWQGEWKAREELRSAERMVEILAEGVA